MTSSGEQILRRPRPMRLLDLPRRLLLDWSLFPALATLLLLGEALLGALIIRKVPYTEIDWVAYMQEVAGFRAGERDYLNLRGDTGPLVYPAGFVYLFSGLQVVTDEGTNIQLAQWIFLGFYLLLQAAALALFAKTRPAAPWVAVLLCVSRRIHSIFVLRLFNDGIATLLTFAAVNFFVRRQWSLGCILYSLAVSVKMNALLLAPGLLVLLLRNTRWTGTVLNLSLCAAVQVLLGLPFLTTFPASYLLKAFELSRVFEFQWTVNWKFLPEDIFVSKPWALLLLAAHLATLFALLSTWFGSANPARWVHPEHDPKPHPTDDAATASSAAAAAASSAASSSSASASSSSSPSSSASSSSSTPTLRRRRTAEEPSSPEGSVSPAAASRSAPITTWTQDEPLTITLVLFASNFVGIAFSRTLHYQFYVWYFHTLPFLLGGTRLSAVAWGLVFLGIEIAFNIFPATPASSAVLHAAHALLLFGLFTAQSPLLPPGK